MPKYSPDVCRQIAQEFNKCNLVRPMRVDHYDAGTELSYEMTGVAPADKAQVTLAVDKFIGGGFAGQVYRVIVKSLSGPCGGLEIGKRYAMKILVPPSRGSKVFRDAVYMIGFQGSFSPQVNVSAARAGALWQKFIRRAAALRFGSERTVKDIHATFVDSTIGSCGEISEWVEGRNWRFECDDGLDTRSRRLDDQSETVNYGASPEYLSKKTFMDDFVKMLHEMGASEFARQYYWWTCKSQPNVFKRSDTEAKPTEGLTAMDFRAGLALLPFLPMSPGDVVLIGKGIARGSLVQFDRPNMKKFLAFVSANAGKFEDMQAALAELIACEERYRESLLDVTHHHVRLLYSAGLWRSVLEGARESWKTRRITDDIADASLRRSRCKTIVFALLGLIPLLGRMCRRSWGRADLRAHYGRMVRDVGYLRQAVRGRLLEKLITWHRKGRVSEAHALWLMQKPVRILWELPLGFMFVFIHRWCTDGEAFRSAMRYAFVRPVRLYFNAEERQRWMLDMIEQGISNGMLSSAEADGIKAQLQDDYIQKYLKALAVHVCTLPITQVVSVTLGIILGIHYGGSFAEGMAIAGFTIAIFQMIPVSPGSFTRGAYVVYLALKERNYRDYNIAIFLGFFKYVGYLAFPIQMAYRYPSLARFMAGHWATGAVHVVPVFGERGALLEHAAFDLFYNHPLTIRRRMGEVAQARLAQAPRRWHVAPIAGAVVLAMAAIELVSFHIYGALPTLKNIWWAVIALPGAFGALTTLWAGGMAFRGRIMLVLKVAPLMAAASALAHLGLMLALNAGGEHMLKIAAMDAMWRVFLFGLLGVLGALRTEISVAPPAPAPSAVEQKVAV